MILLSTFLMGLGAEPQQDTSVIQLVVEASSLMILDANEEAVRFYGYGKDTLESKTITQLDYDRKNLAFRVSDQKDLVVLQRTAKGGSQAGARAYPILPRGNCPTLCR